LLSGALWTAGLAACGVLPAGCDSRWSLLPPRAVPWEMKPLGSARVGESALPEGRVRLYVEHEVLRGVTPAMLAWWWPHIDGLMTVGSNTWPRYLVWHPVDHIHFEIARRAADGGIGPGAVFHIVEALGADMRNLVDVRLHLREAGEQGALVEVMALGRSVLQINARFRPDAAGTRVVSTMTIGPPWGATGRWLVDRLFPPQRRQAWLRHCVEEIGNLEFFLPALYAQFRDEKSGSR
jgi:hypothetical protein